MFNTPEVLAYCEKYGIYELYSEKGNVIIYYSYYGKEGFVRVYKNVKTGREVRRVLRYRKTPKFLKTEDGCIKYNYFIG